MLAPIVTLHIAQIDDLHLPVADDWLSVAERQELARFRAPHRREEWLAGRWLAKQMIGATVTTDSSDHISISTYCPATRRGIAPRIVVNDRPWPGTLSIAHADGWVAVACQDEGLSIGIDLSPFQSLPTGFSGCWFTSDEQAALANQCDTAPLRYWVAKEALFKALGKAQSFRPQDYELHQGHDNRLSPSRVSDTQLTEFEYPAGLLAVAAPHGCLLRMQARPSGGHLTSRRTSFTKVYA